MPLAEYTFGDYLVAAVVLMLAGSAVVAVWDWWIGRKPGKEERIRVVALGLAIESHGESPGADSDRCFTARAKHFEKYLTTGKVEA